MPYLEKEKDFKIISIWNAPNQRPSKKPKFLKPSIFYGNKDFLGDWDTALFGYFADFKKITYLVQVKPQIDYKLYEELHNRYTNSGYRCYFATYQKAKPEKVEDIYITKLPHFWVVRMTSGEFK